MNKESINELNGINCNASIVKFLKVNKRSFALIKPRDCLDNFWRTRDEVKSGTLDFELEAFKSIREFAKMFEFEIMTKD